LYAPGASHGTFMNRMAPAGAAAARERRERRGRRGRGDESHLVVSHEPGP